MLIVLSLYFLVVWLVFSQFKWLPRNRTWKSVVWGTATVIGLVVIGALQHYTPSSSIVVVQASTQQIYPVVSGRVIGVHVDKTQTVEPGEVDPGFRNQRSKPSQEVQRLEDDVHGRTNAAGAGCAGAATWVVPSR